MAYLYEAAPLATPEDGTTLYPNPYAGPPEGLRPKKSAVKQSMACFKVFKAVLARLIFAAHGFVAIWRVTDVYKNTRYFYLCGTLGCLFLETVLSVCIRQGEELKWFSPSVFFYLATVCPSVWFLELDRVNKAVAALNNPNTTTTTTTTRASVVPGAYTNSTKPPNGDGQLSDNDWLKIFEQALMVILIVGRWLLPKGELTRDQLSQLLLVYIGMAADIIEIFEAFREESVIRTEALVYTTLALWTWSLMQFTLVLTATKSRRTRLAANSMANPILEFEESDEDRGPCSCCWWCSADIWGILTTLVLQDGPFLCLRLTFLFKYWVVSYSNIFFTIKNSLVIVLQVYRTVVLLHYSRRKKDQVENQLRNGHVMMHTSKSFPDRMHPLHSFDTISA